MDAAPLSTVTPRFTSAGLTGSRPSGASTGGARQQARAPRHFRTRRGTLRVVRWVDLEGCGHFRDVGGYPTVDGKRTRWRTLYRSASLDALTEDAVADFRGLEIRSVVDLRTEDERVASQPWNDDGSVRVLSLPSSNPARGSLRLGSYDPGALYIAALEDRARDLPTILQLLLTPEALPAVISCSGGKDRTGMVVALVLGILGVPEATIVEDYALSDEFITRDPAAYAAALERVSAAGLDPEVLRTRPETMERFLRTIASRHGSISAFAEASGVPSDTLTSLRDLLLEKSATGHSD